MKAKMLHFIFSLVVITNAGVAQKNDWTILFDGSSTDKFRGYNIKTFPDQAWKVEDGALATVKDVPNIDLVLKKRIKISNLILNGKFL